jgi:hypothetical protein
VTALVTNVVVGAFPGHFVAVWGVAALFVFALGLPIAAFQVLVGAAGTGIGAVMLLVIGNPASGSSSAPELLPGFWRDLSQLLPPGAATTAMRDVVYFHGRFHLRTRLRRVGTPPPRRRDNELAALARERKHPPLQEVTR